MALRRAYTASSRQPPSPPRSPPARSPSPTTGVTTLDDNFYAGGERVIDVQMTLVAYFCATAVVIAVTAVPAPAGRCAASRPVAAAAGALAPIPLIAARADEYVGGLGTDAVLAGAIVGAIAAFAADRRANTPAIGVAAHLALLWLATFAFLPLGRPDRRLRRPGAAARHHHPRRPVSAASSATTCRRCCRTRSSRSWRSPGALGAWFAPPWRVPGRRPAIRAAVAAPVLAAVLYPVVGIDLWNGEAAPVAAGVAVLGAVAAAVGATVGRRRTRPDIGSTGRRARAARAASIGPAGATR